MTTYHGITIDETGRHVPRWERESAKYLPTPDEIQAGCDEIQSGWSKTEKSRRHNPATAWTVPVVTYQGSE